MTQHACDIMCCCLVGSWIKGLELRRGAWAKDSSVVDFPSGRLLKTKKWVRMSREDRQREEKQAQDRTLRNSKSKGKSGERKHIKVAEKYVVSVQKIHFGRGNQDRGVGRHTAPPRTTKRRTTTI